MQRTGSFYCLGEHVYVYKDTCNVYVLRDGSECILIDFGSGAVLGHLDQIGVRRIRSILHTHHHREQVQGDALAVSLGIPIYVPEKEITLWEHADQYWNEMFQKEWHCLGAPYVRPSRVPIRVESALRDGEELAFGGMHIRILETPGHTPGSICILTDTGNERVTFTGDLLMKDGKAVNLYDSEWDYGFGVGLKAWYASCRRLAGESPGILYPSQGDVISDGEEALKSFADRMEHMVHRYFLRDYDMSNHGEGPFQPTPLPFIEEMDQVSPHVLRWRKQNGNLYMIIRDSGKALLIDAGIIHYHMTEEEREQYFEQRLESVMQHFKIDRIEAVLLTHVHGDHYDIYPFIRKRYGAELWCMDSMKEVVENPEKFNLFALFPSYHIYEGKKITVDRVFQDGECMQWEGLTFHFFHLPGQTYYAMGIAVNIDGVNTVFAGDNLFYSKTGSGHEAFTMRNKAILEEGYLKCAETLLQMKPDRLLCGHSIIIDQPKEQLLRLRHWAVEFRDILHTFSPDPEYEWLIDPYWLELSPFQSIVSGTGNQEIPIGIRIRNHHHRESEIGGTLKLPQGWEAEPMQFTIGIGSKGEAHLNTRVSIPAGTPPGRYPITVDLVKNGVHLGEWFDAVIEIASPDSIHK